MTSIKIDVDTSQVKALFDRLRTRMGDMTPVFKNIGEYMLRSTDNRFRYQKDPQNKDWASLTLKYRQRKEKQPRAIQKILQYSGRLRGSLIYKPYNDKVIVGTNVVYSRTHQFGSSKGVPSRPFLGVNQKDITSFSRIIRGYLT